MTISKPHTLKEEILRIFEAQQANRQAVAQSSARERIAKLKRLQDALMRYRGDIREALHNDFRKHPMEVDLTELYVVASEIRFTVRNLRRWMKLQRVPTPLALIGSRSYIHYQPKGVVLIIAPWNFPVNLTLGPLVSAIAAGNCAMLKPSEHTPHTSAIMRKIVKELFPENEVALVEGGIETSQALLELPFNHIFFTGSPNVGKIVMAAAAKHLASVTLELGGKSPTIVDETADIDLAAARIAWAKFTNAGQACIAPDYLLVHESRLQEFLDKLALRLKAQYGEDARTAAAYARVVNKHHFERVKAYVEDARRKGAETVIGGQMDEATNYIAPTVMTGVSPDTLLMTEEIFGPVLPVYGFRSLQEPIDRINAGEKPLALYIFSRNRKNIRRILNQAPAGGACINHSIVHFNNHNLPFGGDNNSGIGKSHGRYGFEAFSNAQGVYRQVLPFNAVDLLKPPFTALKQRLMDFTMKWL